MEHLTDVPDCYLVDDVRSRVARLFLADGGEILGGDAELVGIIGKNMPSVAVGAGYYYQAGTATISDLLDAQTLYQQSRDKYVESVTNYEVKKREYLLATGR